MTTVALAGRRIDAADADEPRFPLANRARVAEQIRQYLQAHRVQRLVCSAACGADLLALQEAQKLGGVTATIVLPFAEQAFRNSSVTDRPGNWGPVFDAALAKARAEGLVVELGLQPGDRSAYQIANDRILEEAVESDP